jgi:hypothetical protein
MIVDKIEFYKKLLVKLKKIESEEMTLHDYIIEVDLKINPVCNCKIPYFPTGNIKHCSKCGKPTVY